MEFKLDLGEKYSKRDLIPLLKEPLRFCREGVFNCNNSSTYILFVDLDQSKKEKRFRV